MLGEGSQNTGRWSEHDEDDNPLVDDSVKEYKIDVVTNEKEHSSLSHLQYRTMT